MPTYKIENKIANYPYDDKIYATESAITNACVSSGTAAASSITIHGGLSGSCSYSNGSCSNHWYSVDSNINRDMRVPGDFVYYNRKRKHFSKVFITEVIYSNPATVVFWSDGTKTVSKCRKPDTYNPEVGLYACIVKKLYGRSVKNIFKCWIPDGDTNHRKVTLKDARKNNT